MGLRGKTVGLVVALVAFGLFAARPFLSDRMVGTGESYNYCLSLADAVTQMRAGIVPPLAGQTPYAFNGRIHPLRNAPYLHYLAFAIDALTFHRLTFWQLQNVSLAFSLVAAFLSCFIGLRWGVGCPRLAAFVLAVIYGLSPPLLGAAYSFELFMTVHAAVFVPLAVGACLKSCLKPSFSNDAWLAAALAVAWLAHAPVALWLTVCVCVVRLISFGWNPTPAVFFRGCFAFALWAALASFVFVSVTTVGSLDLGEGANAWRPLANIIVTRLSEAFPASILPVSRGAGLPSDLQTGYAPLALVAFGIAALFGAKRANIGRLAVVAASGTFAAVLMLLALDLPIPGITRWLWWHVPPTAIQLTTLWPMQRLYLVAVAFALFGASLVVPEVLTSSRFPKWAACGLSILAIGWSVYQAVPFIDRGLGDRWTAEKTETAFKPTNLDLTVTSYAYLQTSPTFVYGVMDPAYEFRLLLDGGQEVGSPLTSGLATSKVVSRGVITASRFPSIVLQPKKRYLLSFDFKMPPGEGFLQVKGAHTMRTYALPSAGGDLGFGMKDGQRRAFSVWTDDDQPEPVEIQVSGAVVSGAGKADPFADFTLEEVDPSDLSVQLEGYLPMRFVVECPRLGCTVETPFRYISGYEAKVNGEQTTALDSPSGQVMVPVPAGRSTVEVMYRGPIAARITFWLCAGCWGGFVVWRLTGSRLPIHARNGPVAAKRAGAYLRKQWIPIAALAAGLCAAVFGTRLYLRHGRYLAGVGPIEIRFRMHYGNAGSNQPLLCTGRPFAGTVIFVTGLDERHVRFGADVWGRLYQSKPVEIDLSKVHRLVVSDTPLYPRDHPALSPLGADELRHLRSNLSIEFDGGPVIAETCNAYESSLSEILPGKAPFGSLTQGDFKGEILGVSRLPIPRSLILPSTFLARVTARFPTDRIGASEPLISGTQGDRAFLCYATYLAPGRLRISSKISDTASIDSAETDFDPSKDHTVDFDFGERNDGSQSLQICCLFDGIRFLGKDPAHVPGQPATVLSSINATSLDGSLYRFSGPKLNLELVARAGASTSSGPPSPMHIVLAFPSARFGRSEPLLTTGHTGKGDFVYVSYVDRGHIRIGFDHWGTSGPVSAPIGIDFKQPHEVWISLASLDSPAARDRLSVVFDGKIVLSSDITPYPSATSEVAVGRNTIGGSTEDPEFTGTIYLSERRGIGRSPTAGL